MTTLSCKNRPSLKKTLSSAQKFNTLDSDTFPLMKTILERNELKIIQVKDVTLTLDDIKFLTSGVKMSEDQFDEIVDKLLEVNCKLLMLRAEEHEKVCFK